MRQLRQERRCPVQGVFRRNAPLNRDSWPGLATLLGRHAKCAARYGHLIEPALRHLCAAGFAQEIKEQRGHFHLMGIGVNDGIAPAWPAIGRPWDWLGTLSA
jgi:hypothetical protein